MILYNTIVGLAAAVGLAQRFSEYGARFLTRDEIAEQLPLYPKLLPSNPERVMADPRTIGSA